MSENTTALITSTWRMVGGVKETDSKSGRARRVHTQNECFIAHLPQVSQCYSL